MNKLIVIALTLFSLSAHAQFDERFYLPKSGWQHEFEDFNMEEYSLAVDKDSITSVLLKPDTSNGVTVLYFHGAGGNISYYSKFVAPLVSAGYQVYMVDFRGYGKSTGRPLHTNIATDAEVVLAHLKALPETQGQRLWVYGASLGSQIAAHITRKHEDDIAALILDGPMASFTDIALESSPEEQRTIIQLYVTSPYAAKEDVKKLSSTPLLVISSPGDTSIPMHQSQLVYDNAGGPKLFWEYEGEHLEAPVRHTEAFLQQLEALKQLQATNTSR